MKSHDWTPNISYGSIKLGDNIYVYQDSLGAFEQENSKDETGWLSYRLPDEEVFIYVEGECISCITTYEKCYFRGSNLIGMTLAELENCLGTKNDEIGQSIEYSDGDVQTPVEFLPLGLQVWLSIDKVLYVSIIDSNSP